MAIYSEEEIKKFRQRWTGREDLIEAVIGILKGEGKADSDEEKGRRLEKANELLSRNGFLAVGGFKMEVSEKIIIAPGLDLRGIDLNKKDLRGIVFEGAHLEGAILNFAHLEKAILHGTHLERAYFLWAHLEGALLLEAHLEGAFFFGAHLEGAYIGGAHLEGAELIEAHLEGANFSLAKFGELKWETFSDECSLSKDEREMLVKERGKTRFSANDFLPYWRDHFFENLYFWGLFKNLFKLNPWRNARKHIKFKRPDWKGLWRHISDRWNYTDFTGVRIDDADTVMAADLRRYVRDQQYLHRFKNRHPYMHFFWKLFTDCGWSMFRVGFWAAAFVVLFALIYWAMSAPTPDWLEPFMPEIFRVEEFPINPRAFYEGNDSIEGFWRWLFISFDIFSNLGLRSTQPQNPTGVILVLLESMSGFLSLGMLISVLSNRFARRS